MNKTVRGLPKLKKSWAEIYRSSMVALIAPALAGSDEYSSSGVAYGCCYALDLQDLDVNTNSAVSAAFYTLFGLDWKSSDRKFQTGNLEYWWPTLSIEAEENARGYTERIMALELAAILCEEFGK